MIRRIPAMAAISFLVATSLSLWSCGSDPQTGTSSETQTELQLLADNSRWIAQPNGSTASRQIVSARRSAVSVAEVPEDCQMDSSTQYEGVGKFYRLWRGSCMASSDSLSRIRRKRTLKHDAFGSQYLDFLESDTRSQWFSEGHGWMRLRGSLRLEIDTFRVAFESAGVTAWYHYRFAESCTFEYRASATATETGYRFPDRVRSPVVCGGKAIGFVVWDITLGMVVQDLDGRAITALPRPEVAFREDSLGLQLVALTPRSETDPTPVGGRYRLKVLADETIPDTASFSARDTGGFGSYLVSLPGRALRDGTFEADFRYAPYKPWRFTVSGRSWEAISTPILP